MYDNSVTFPVLDIYAQKLLNLNVLLFEAYENIYDNFQDNQFSNASPFARLMETKIIHKLIQVGIRTIDKHKRQQIIKIDLDVFEMKDFYFKFINKLKGPLYFSINLDSLGLTLTLRVSHHEPVGL